VRRGTHHVGLRGALLAVVVLLSAGCVTTPDWYRKYQQPYRAHPELSQRSRTVRVVGLLPPDIKIYELTAGGVTELRDEWSAAGRDAVRQGLTEVFKERGIALKPLVVDKDLQRSVDDITLLYRAVSGSIIEHTYREHPFPTKLENFDYSVGSIDPLLQRYQADGIVIVYGVDQISTAGRKALRGVGLVLGAVTGQAVLSQGTTALTIALVDRTGAVLWYKITGDSGGFDLRDSRSAKAFVQRLVTDFPPVGR
jgi:DNA-binding PadR family transcriptional regulator